MLNISYINQIYKMPEKALNNFLSLTEPIVFKKGDLIFREAKAEKFIYIIQKGIARAYKTQNNQEVTFWFGIEGDTVISIKNYVEGVNSYETIEAVEDILAYRISTDLLKKLYIEDVHVANWGRCYAEKEMLKNEERLISRQFKSATERYLELISSQPQIIRRVPLRYIASYLGITQVSLSRIRAELK
jgi:CRP-like cAMP-binding protein